MTAKAINPEMIPQNIEAILPPEEIKELAIESGFVKRLRKIDPYMFILSLILGFGVNIHRNLSTMKRCYEKQMDCHLSDGSWYERFTPSLVNFLRAIVQLALSRMSQDYCHQLSDKLKHFEDVLIQDSTIIRLNAILATKWPAVRTRAVAAGIKVSTIISVVQGAPTKIRIYGERMSEIKTLKIGPWVKNRILLFDLAFQKYQIFARIGENGGYFLTRLKDNANPLIIASLRVHRGNAIDIEGQNWQDVKDRLKREVLDAEIEVDFKRRKYLSNRTSDTVILRMVAVWDNESQEYHTYITNIPFDLMEAEDIADLYRVRWLIELMFKELKGKYALDVITTSKPHIIEGLIWSSILAMILSRQLYRLLLKSVVIEKRERYTPMRWSNSFIESSQMLLLALEDYYYDNKQGLKTLKRLASLWEHQTLDPRVKRKRLSGGWYS